MGVITYRDLGGNRFEADVNGTVLTLELSRERGYPGMPGSKRDGMPHLDMYQKAWGILGPAPLRVLDCACGSGYGTAFLRDQGCTVSGVDVSADPVAFARAAYADERASFVVADMVDLPFAYEIFDAVVSVEAIEHTAEPVRALREFRRVLRTGGTLFITTPQGSEWKPWSPFHMWEARMDEFEKMLNEAGFTNQRWWPSPTEWVVTSRKEG